MSVIPCPRELLDTPMDRMDQARLDVDAYRQLGAFVLRGAIPRDVISHWMDAWGEFQSTELAGGRRMDPFNPVVLHEPVPEPLAGIYRHRVLLDIMEALYPDLGLYLQRWVIKDRHNHEPVFLHQDYCYNLGWPDKTSVMLPLGPMNPDNGGLVVYPGTHRLGYLGDAGQLDEDVLDNRWPRLAPSLEPGDLLLVHDCSWHASPPRSGGPDRIVAQITYQPADDPSTAEVLRGTARSGYCLGGVDRARFFRRSRSSRLRALQARLDELEGPEG